MHTRSYQGFVQGLFAMKTLLLGCISFAMTTRLAASPLENHVSATFLASDKQAQASSTKQVFPGFDTKRLSADTVIKTIQTLRKNNELKKARSLAIAYLKQHPENVDVILLLGLIYKQAGTYSQAKVLFNLVLEEIPEYIDARLSLANILITEKKYDDALNLIHKGLTLSPRQHQLQTLKKRVVTLQSSPS